MKDEIKEIKVNKANKSITFINNGIAFSQFGIADEILDLIINLQEEIKSANESITWWQNRFNVLQEENKRLRKDYGRLMQDNAYTLELEQRNEKANEFIKEHTNNFAEYLDVYEVKELSNILQGEDKE